MIPFEEICKRQEFGGEFLKMRIAVFRQSMQEKLARIRHALKLFAEKFPIIITVYHVISWLSLIVFLLSLIILEDSRTIMVQFLWSFYVILQFWLLARSKTLPWKQYITFFLVGAWIVTPFTALFINGIHLIFGGNTSNFWSDSILTPIAEELFKLIPVIVFLFFSKRTSSFSLTDFMLMGAAVGAGFQFLEETARRLQSGGFLPYGHDLFGKALNWDLFSLFPGWLEYEYFPYIMTASHAVLTALMSLGIGIAFKLRSHLKYYAYLIPIILFIMGTLDHAAWNGDGSMPDWVKSIHELLGNGYYAKPLLLILLVGAIIADYWRLNKKRDELILLKGERTINPLSEVYQLLRTFIMKRNKFWDLMYFYRGRRELSFVLLSGDEELHDRTDRLRQIVENHYKMIIAVTGILLIIASAMTSELLLHNSANSCFACLFDGLQFWWDRLSGVEKGAIVLMGFAISFPLLGFWSAFGAVTTTTGIFTSGNQIADIIRNPKNLMSTEYAMSAIVVVGFNRIPGGKAVADELLDARKNSRHLDNVDADQKFNSSKDVTDDTTFESTGKDYKNYKAVEYTGSTKVDGELRDISRKVFQRIDIDYMRIDPDTGLTNYQLMKKGRAPIWKDGTVIELHHLIQREPGSMVEIPASMHDEYYKILHGLVENGRSFRNDPVLKKQYDNFRSKYWRWRAKLIDQNEL